ncbi:MAG TPA: hydantoinase B/oxoprolinase family protein [Terriglobales bacterium]|nr:hydantoinase B/oxoprolinase family protein [Terriglobales bacterium]
MRDPVELEVFKNLYHSIAEEMGAALRRTSFSPNIKERRDYSCAVFDSAGQVIAMGDHMPVHLGSMPMSVAAAVGQCELEPGDVVMLNDPFRGGTHLPDITLVMPVYLSQSQYGDGAVPRPGGAKPRHHTTTPDFYVASRAHHADVGGTYPGSMGPCREIYQEGFRIPPVKIMCGGKLVADVLALLLNNVRTPEEREGDLGAQIAACQTGAQRLREICERYGIARAKRAATDLLVYSEEMMRAFLRTIPPGRYQAEDFLDNDGVEDKPVRIAVTIHVKASSSRKPAALVTIDFTGSDAQVQGAINAVEAIAYSACFYVFRCLLREDVPATSGLMRPIRVIAPAGTVVNARPPAAVAGGNVETSQRIVDVLLKALAQAIPDRIPAAAAGTMNNLTIGGIDRRSDAPRSGEPFAYYETIAGGMGARCSKDGVSGVHTHMTNSLNTPAEALEYAYPIRLRQYSFRPNSGGAGLHTGGDGIVREIEVLTDTQVTLLADRRSRGPYGLAGGTDGAPGRTLIIRRDGSAEEIPGKTSVRLRSGERVRIESPGGGGWGRSKLAP